jgi:hypothetical protein
LFLSSCNLIDPLGDDLDDLNSTIDQEITYTLTDDDYATIAERAVYLDENDSVNAAFIEANKYFTDDIAATYYVPMALDVIMPNLIGSSAEVSYNYYGDAPEDLTEIANLEVYALTASDFEMVDSTVAYLDYFASPYQPDDYIPKILKHSVQYEGDDDTIVVAYYYSENAVEVELTNQLNAEFEESFDNYNTGLLTVSNIQGDQTWAYVNQDNGAVSIEGYDDEYNDNEDWLVSPTINLSDISNTYLQIKHNVRYFADGCLSLMVTTDLDSEVSSASWSEYAIDDPGTDIGEFEYSKLFNLNNYDGEKIRFAFRYKSSKASETAPKWTISEVKIGNYGYNVIGGGDEYLVEDYYQFDAEESEWILIDDIHKVNNSDYDLLSLSSTEFSESLPAQDYLPELAELLYPKAAVGDVVYLVYDYNSGSDVTLADMLTKSDDTWTSTYSYIQETSSPFRNSDGNWNFDPSVIFTMDGDDYQIIVDYVNSVPEYAENNSSLYSNTEYYFGASAYFDNFDIRAGSYYSGFESWEDAVLTALLEGLLPNKYPDATKYVGGVEALYYVTYQTYSGARTYYTCTFEVSKDAPNPEFSIVDGPTVVE